MAYASASGDTSVILTGDAMISRGLTMFSEPEYLELRELLRGADVAFTNAEMLFHNYEDAPTTMSGTWMRADPRLIEDLKWLGVNMVSCANNHGYDYGEGGVTRNIAELDAAGLAHAGSGANLAAAVRPAYLDTAGGRIALVAATSTGRASARAGEQRRDMGGRPGINLLRWVQEWTVDDEVFTSLTKMAAAFDWPKKMPAWWETAYRRPGDESRRTLAAYDRILTGLMTTEDPAACMVQGESFARHSRIHSGDLERNLQSVREARRMADVVIFSIHNHESGAATTDPSDHIVEVAHAAIDAGADVVVGHGAHRDRGIEIYRGRPIFYSLGNFIKQNETVERLPQEIFSLWGLGHESCPADLYDLRSNTTRSERPGPTWYTVVPRVSLRGGALSQIDLHPIELGWGTSRGQSGRPIIARGDSANMIVGAVAELSEAFGTTIKVVDGVGSIEF